MTTRASEAEIKYYFEEVFGDSGNDLEFKTFNDNIEPKLSTTKFDLTRFTFNYGFKKFEVMTGNGLYSDKFEPTIHVMVKELDVVTSKAVDAWDNMESWDRANKCATYDPIVVNGRELLEYVKSVLDGDDDNTSEPVDDPLPTDGDEKPVCDIRTLIKA